MLKHTLSMSERLACRAVGLARSTYRRLLLAQTPDDPDAEMRAWLRTYATKHPGDLADRLLDIKRIYHEPDIDRFPRARQALYRFAGAELVEVPSHQSIPVLYGNEGNVEDSVRINARCSSSVRRRALPPAATNGPVTGSHRPPRTAARWRAPTVKSPPEGLRQPHHGAHRPVRPRDRNCHLSVQQTPRFVLEWCGEFRRASLFDLEVANAVGELDVFFAGGYASMGCADRAHF